MNMQRRDFITLLGGAVAAWPLAAQAQQPRVPRIGILVNGPLEPFRSLLREALRDLGHVDGHNMHIEFRSTEGKSHLLPELAAELVRLKVEIIVASQTPAAQAVKQATTEIPIVILSGDPVGTGLVASLARPGGNVTGVSGATAEIAAKNVELMKEMLPSARRMAVLANATDPFTKTFLAHIQLAGQTLGIAIQPLIVHGAEEFDAAFSAMLREQADAVIVQPSLPRHRAVALALQHRVPAASPGRPFVADGGLLAYVANTVHQHRKLAVYMDKILKGALPADLPVEQPTKFDLVINLKTAKALGLDVPPMLLARADEVIE